MKVLVHAVQRILEKLLQNNFLYQVWKIIELFIWKIERLELLKRKENYAC